MTTTMKLNSAEPPFLLEHAKPLAVKAAVFLRRSGSSKGRELIAVLRMMVYLDLMKWGNNYSSALTYNTARFPTVRRCTKNNKRLEREKKDIVYLL